MDLVITNEYGIDTGFLPDSADIDFEIGGNNDFEITIPATADMLNEKRLYCVDSELGGIVRNREVNTKENTIKYTGRTWRGLLDDKIISTSSSSVSHGTGESIKTIINSLLVETGLSNLFVADECGNTNATFQFIPYCTVLSAIKKIISSTTNKIVLKYATSGKIHISFAELKIYDDYVKLSEASSTNAVISETRWRVNHLICIGNNVSTELFTDDTGFFTATRQFSNEYDISAVYEDTSADTTAKLVEGGKNKLREYWKDYIKFSLTSADTDEEYDVGDYIEANEYETTGLYVQAEITSKIINIKDGKKSVQYKTNEG